MQTLFKLSVSPCCTRRQSHCTHSYYSLSGRDQRLITSGTGHRSGWQQSAPKRSSLAQIRCHYLYCPTKRLTTGTIAPVVVFNSEVSFQYFSPFSSLSLSLSPLSQFNLDSLSEVRERRFKLQFAIKRKVAKVGMCHCRMQEYRSSQNLSPKLQEVRLEFVTGVRGR